MTCRSDQFSSRVTRAIVAALLAFAGAAQATALDPDHEAPGKTGATGTATTFVSVTPVYQGGADLDDGGDLRFDGVVLRGGMAFDLGGGNRAGITLVYDYLDYSFSNPQAFGSNAPWGIVQRYGVTAPLSFDLGSGWILGVAPAFEWFRENGAGAGDSFTWGASFSGTRRFQDGNALGLGLAVFNGIEETLVFPFITVDWRLGDRWRLINPLATGPTGPAGLELDYEFGGGWTAGLGTAWRVLRFRLSESGPTPNGIGEERGMPVFLRVTHRFSPQTALHVYGGIVLNGQLRIEDSSGARLRQDDLDPAPLLGASFIARF